MSGDLEAEVAELLERAAELPDHSQEAVALLERAGALADALRDTELGYEVRRRLLTPACFAGMPDRLLVAFSWCLAASDAEPERFPESDVLWQYKWVLIEAPAFPEIARERITGLLDDFQKRVERNGATLRCVEQFRCYAAMVLGDPDEAHRAAKAWRRARRDWMADCKACETDGRVLYHVWAGEDEKALKAAAPIMKGKESCSAIPELTDARVLLPLLRCGRRDEARRFFLRGSRRSQHCDTALVETMGFRLDFLALTDNLTRGVQTLEEHLGRALAHANAVHRMNFLLAGAFLMERVRDAGRGELRLRLGGDVPWRSEDGVYAVDELAARLRGDAEAIAHAFDRRNANSAIGDGVRERAALHDRVEPLDLSAS